MPGDVLGQRAAGVTTAVHHVGFLVNGERFADRRDLVMTDPSAWLRRGGLQGGD